MLSSYLYGNDSNYVTGPYAKNKLAIRNRNKTAAQKKKNTPFKQIDEMELTKVQQEAIGKKNFPLGIKYLEHRLRLSTNYEKNKKSTTLARKRTAVNKKKNTTLKQMDEIELTKVQQEANEKKNFPLAIKCLERRMRLSTNGEMLANLIFELGEVQFEFGKLDLAIITLNDFKKRFPGHKDIEEAHYKTCVASILNTLGSERDQTNTDIAINFANEYLNHPAQFQKYRSEVEAFKKQALTEKANHELMVCKFYKKQGHLTAAKKRAEYLENEFLTDLPEINSQILALKEEFSSPEKLNIMTDLSHKGKKFKERF
jgi:outer membrane assembly lipoprotein YfiO